MTLPQSTIERIEKEAVSYFTNPHKRPLSTFNKSNRIINAYAAGATAEASRSQLLVEALEKIEAKIMALIQEDPKGRAIEVAVIMANALKEISGITAEALKHEPKTDNQ